MASSPPFWERSGKFHNGDYLNCGVTGRGHNLATAVEHIGKEANRWEEQFYLGLDLEAQTEYGISPEDYPRIIESLAWAGKKFGQRRLAKVADVSLSELSALLSANGDLASRLYLSFTGQSHAWREAREQGRLVREVLETVRDQCRRIGVRQFAKRAKVDAANLAHVLSGRRKPSQVMLAKLEKALEQGSDWPNRNRKDS